MFESLGPNETIAGHNRDHAILIHLVVPLTGNFEHCQPEKE
jgi:hypothetical protein